MTLPLKTRLENLVASKQLDNIPVNIKNVQLFFNKANKKCRFGRSLIATFEDKHENDNDIFTGIYDSLRIGYLSLLTMYGYKTKTTGGHHQLALRLGPEILIEELSKISSQQIDCQKLERSIKRAQNIARKRSDDLYEPLDDIISRTNLETFLIDVEFILKNTGITIHNFLE